MKNIITKGIAGLAVLTSLIFGGKGYMADSKLGAAEAMAADAQASLDKVQMEKSALLEQLVYSKVRLNENVLDISLASPEEYTNAYIGVIGGRVEIDEHTDLVTEIRNIAQAEGKLCR